MKAAAWSRILVGTALLVSSLTMAQERELSSFRNGTIETVMQDDKFIVIDGTRYVYRAADVEVSYKGVPLPHARLSQGQDIQYRTHSDGSVRVIVVTAPNRELDEVEPQ